VEIGQSKNDHITSLAKEVINEIEGGEFNPAQGDQLRSKSRRLAELVEDSKMECLLSLEIGCLKKPFLGPMRWPVFGFTMSKPSL